MATGLAYWTGDAASAWDTLILGGEVWPGVWVVEGDGVGRRVDVKATKGGDGGTVKDNGYRNAKLTATGTIYTAEQWAELQRLLPVIHPRRKGGERKPLQIIYPSVNLLGIDTVYLTDLPILSLDKSAAMGTIVIKLVEWYEAPKPVKKGAGIGQRQIDLASLVVAQALAEAADSINNDQGTTGELLEDALNSLFDWG